MKHLLFIGWIAVILISCGEPEKKRSALPYYGPSEVNAEGDSVFHKIPSFSFVNQSGEIVNERDFEGKLYVADFFFTTCEGICPKMTKQMHRVQEAFKNDSMVMMLSHTVDPETDSVAVLAQYAKDMQVDSKKWHLVTGGKKEIYELAYSGYFANVLEAPDSIGGQEDFIHSENLLLIDTEKHIRGIYEGTNPSEVDRLIRDVKVLRQEMEEGKKK